VVAAHCYRLQHLPHQPTCRCHGGIRHSCAGIEAASSCSMLPRDCGDLCLPWRRYALCLLAPTRIRASRLHPWRPSLRPPPQPGDRSDLPRSSASSPQLAWPVHRCTVAAPWRRTAAASASRRVALSCQTCAMVLSENSGADFFRNETAIFWTVNEWWS